MELFIFIVILYYMDIYQIWVTHNPAWTRREIIFFVVVFTIVTIIEAEQVHRHRVKVYQAIASLLLLVFIAIVYASTVFTRNPMPYARYKLELFWSYKYILNGNRYYAKECFLNFLLLMPVGLLLPYVFDRKISWWKGLLCGIILSGGVEVLQLILRRGLFELDDIFHNSMGCMLTTMISSCVYGTISKFFGKNK